MTPTPVQIPPRDGASDSVRTTEPAGIFGVALASGNRGVAALGASLVKLLVSSDGHREVTFFGSNPSNAPAFLRPLGKPMSVAVAHWRMSPRAALRDHLATITASSFLYRFLPFKGLQRWLAARVPWIAALKSTAFAGDVRGGDSFSDIYGLYRFLIATLPVASVIWIKGSIVLFPQTYGPYKSCISRVIARWIIRRASVIIARDKESQAVAQALARPDQKVLLTPDVAFALHADHMEQAELDGRLVSLPPGAIGLNVNGLMYNGGYTRKNMFGLKLDYVRFLRELVPALLAHHPGPLLLVPHTYAPAGDVESDNDACARLRESLPEALRLRVHIVTGDYDCHQLKGIIGRCEFFVGSRMHSCIAALSQGVPCVGVAYSMKFRGVFESVGVAESVVDGRLVDGTTAIGTVLKVYRARHTVRPRLMVAAENARTALGNTFQKLIGAST